MAKPPLTKPLPRAIRGGGLSLGVAMWVVLAAQATAQPSAATPPDDDPTLVTINGEAITQSDLRVHQVQEVCQLRRPTTNSELARVIAEVTPRSIAAAIDELLMAQKARALGNVFTEDLLQGFLLNARGVFRFPGQTEDFDSNEAVLKAMQESEGLTEREIRRMIERQMLAQRAMQLEILDRVGLTEAEAPDYYDANIEDYTTPATAALREILVAVPPRSGSPADEAAKSTAEAIAARARSGEDFAVLATDASDSPSKTNGGRVGPLLVTEYAKPIQDIIATLHVGDVADPIRTPQGYQIIMLDLLVEAYVRPFDELREEIANSVSGDKRNDAYNSLLKTLRGEATIDWHHDDLRQAYERHRASTPEVQALPVR